VRSASGNELLKARDKPVTQAQAHVIR